MKFFSMDSPLMTFLTKVADLMIINLLFVICCIPVVTIGASFSAMYYVTLKFVKDEEGVISKQFFKAFKDNFKQATIVWLIILVLLSLLVLDFYLISTGAYAYEFRYAVYIFLAVIAILFIHVFPYISRFENKIKDVIKNSLVIAVTHIVKTVFMVLIFAAPIALAFLRIEIFPVLILLGFSVPAFANSVWLVKIYDEITENYFSEKPEDASGSEE